MPQQQQQQQARARRCTHLCCATHCTQALVWCAAGGGGQECPGAPRCTHRATTLALQTPACLPREATQAKSTGRQLGAAGRHVVTRAKGAAEAAAFPRPARLPRAQRGQTAHRLLHARPSIHASIPRTVKRSHLQSTICTTYLSDGPASRPAPRPPSCPPPCQGPPPVLAALMAAQGLLGKARPNVRVLPPPPLPPRPPALSFRCPALHCDAKTQPQPTLALLPDLSIMQGRAPPPAAARGVHCTSHIPRSVPLHQCAAIMAHACCTHTILPHCLSMGGWLGGWVLQAACCRPWPGLHQEAPSTRRYSWPGCPAWRRCCAAAGSGRCR